MASVTCTMTAPPLDPFDDVYALSVESATISDFEDRNGFDGGCKQEKVDSNTVRYPHHSSVPIIDSHSPIPGLAAAGYGLVPGTRCSTPKQQFPCQAIEWSDQDLYYLVYTRFGERVANNYSTSTSYYSTGTDSTNLVTLQLTYYEPATPTSYSADAPIGTGRPVIKVLARSQPSASLPQARRSIAADLLSCTDTLKHAIRSDALLGDIYPLSEAELKSIRSAMVLMRYISEEEWDGRRAQLQNSVGGESEDGELVSPEVKLWSIHAKLELFLLEVGYYEFSTWFAQINDAVGMKSEERRTLARGFGYRAKWLERALNEC
ncbi:unnamed protein product [Periconia digitata]|uniref:Uncharacterized protein n=1 Tax=Periconia digitata TaxID=1303443 RepID=A0A9W4XJV1_9PLEO|nr:unnamed protein product [Periconia digitata]